MCRSVALRITSYPVLGNNEQLFTAKVSPSISVSRLHLNRKTTGGGPTRKAQKKVTFADTCLVRPTLPLHHYTYEEISASWYSEDDYVQQRQKCVSIILKMIHGKPHKYCLRGLEQMTPEASEYHQQSRRDVYAAVNREQNRQCLVGVCDPDALADVYRSASIAKHHHPELAHDVGRRDALAALKIMDKVKRSSSDNPIE